MQLATMGATALAGDSTLGEPSTGVYLLLCVGLLAIAVGAVAFVATPGARRLANWAIPLSVATLAGVAVGLIAVAAVWWWMARDLH